MNKDINAIGLSIVIAVFVLVTMLGFLASRWRPAENLLHLDEWGLGGRKFGGVITWFLMGGDVYTSYVFIAVPAAVYATGAMGFFPVPYVAMFWPLAFIYFPRLWSVSSRRGYVTPADFVRGRFGSRLLALAIAVTGLLGLMPYISLQLIGIQACLDVIGLSGNESAFGSEIPLFVAFAVLAAYTYTAGLRATVLIAFVKDTIIYTVVLVAIVYIPMRLGGWHSIFATAERQLTTPDPDTNLAAGSILLDPDRGVIPYVTLAFGSALAYGLFPHVQTGLLATGGRDAVRRSVAGLGIYSLALGLIAMLGYGVIAAGLSLQDLQGNPQHALPALFSTTFPEWFAGIAYATVVVSALVSAGFMSISAANLFTRNIYREFINAAATPQQETRIARRASLVVKFGALLFVLGFDASNAINFQLLGGLWLVQTLPTVVSGLYTRWFHPLALLSGWLTGMLSGTILAYVQHAPGKAHFASAVASLPVINQKVYIGLIALGLNVIVCLTLTPVLRLLGVPRGEDETQPGDYIKQ
ncbi:sodium:solute symporter [Streptomyces sp. NPDC126514]|uniref:sodium:solute symporter family protein n=1 Tax=Streptomyces sp. NPDC126514 TaxID=3155210 RepID=UPI00331A5671